MATETKSRIVVVNMLGGESKRVNLSGAIDLGIDRREQHGIILRGVYLMPRSQRVIVHTYSIWDRGNGRVEGDSFSEADNDTIAGLAQEFDEERLAALLPMLADA